MKHRGPTKNTNQGAGRTNLQLMLPMPPSTSKGKFIGLAISECGYKMVVHSHHLKRTVTFRKGWKA